MKKILSLLLAGVIALSMVACDNGNEEATTSESTTNQTTEATTDDTQEPSGKLIDRNGIEYELPEKIDTIISCAASNTEIISGLGLADKIIAIDQTSVGIEGIKEDLPQFNMMNLDMEQIINLSPDVVFLNDINYVGEEGKYDILKDAGINIVNIASATSLEDIMSDITFLSKYTKTEDKGNELIAEIQTTIDEIKAKVNELSAEPVSVYFEVSPAPDTYSLGNNTFINDIITLCGGENIFADQESWIKIAEESVVAANPDVIITNCDYTETPVEEIKSRDGWDVINAVKNDKVYLVSSNDTSRASQNIVKGIKDIAKAINPDLVD